MTGAISSQRLDGRVAIVTGSGQPNGIGMGCARSLAAAGAKIIVCATAADRAEERAHELASLCDDAIGVAVDVRSEASVEALIAAAIARFGRIDILVNNAAASAALARDGSVATMALDAWEETFAVNTRGPMLCMKHAAAHLAAQAGSAIVNISSQAARSGSHHAAYGASKAALENLTLHAALALGKQGVRVNCIAPGIVLSQAEPLPEAFLAPWRALTLTPRLGLPADIGAMTAFLASEAAGYITGQIIAVDGGILSHATWTDIPQW